eukprot:357253-Rhodomonas_salina.1
MSSCSFRGHLATATSALITPATPGLSLLIISRLCKHHRLSSEWSSRKIWTMPSMVPCRVYNEKALAASSVAVSPSSMV